MEQSISNCSESILVDSKTIQNEEIQELELETGVSVWGTNQQILEEQALKEITIFTEETNPSTIKLESDGQKDNILRLNIESYIQRQEELRKVQEYKKSLQITNKSKIIADRIVKQQQQLTKNKKKKRKISESNSNNDIKLEEVAEQRKQHHSNDSGSEYFPSEDEGSDYNPDVETVTGLKRKRCNSNRNAQPRVKDDGCLQSYKTRLEDYYKQLEAENTLKNNDNVEEEIPEFYTIKKGLKIPLRIWSNLYSYQQDGVRWLWKLHQEVTGGILGDEMGLGKTVQIIAFLTALEYSQIISMHGRCKGLGPTLIVCPATVIHQWVQHFHEWSPEFRVVVLHQSGSYQGNKVQLIKDIIKNKGILITTYQAILKYKTTLTEYDWHYLILDEGHKIRNSNAKISITVKRIRTPHRLLLTGSPMQNNLQELWSLFDFTNPCTLGNLNTFMEHFVQPIIQGGFVNATPMQEATALSVATTLKDVITPYLLRRCKADVQQDINLPKKSEQVLFCSLTEQQRDLYKGYLMGDQVGFILGKDSKNWFVENQVRAGIWVAITNLRKICNHPDIYLSEANESAMDDSEISLEDRFGYYKKSGKMVVVAALLKIWKRQKHRVLLFTQSRAMVTVFEEFLRQQGYNYLKMDGSTAISSRQHLINKFNEDDSYDVFLLTTRVGGLGVNLTGANRVIIYDPDWNPATDTQARERAWRIGQDKDVAIYRLLSAGTIEEKMYQRQIWKQLLSNKVLIDPKTQRFFKSSNLHDLFSLPDDRQSTNPETTNIFRDSRVKLQERIREKKEHKKRKLKIKNGQVQFSEDKIQAMKDLAQQISRSLATPKEESVKKTSYQIELEEERQKKLREKQELKKLTPSELMYLNREKAKPKPEDNHNKVDDCDTNVSFSKALEYSEETAKLYHDLKTEKVKNLEPKSDNENSKIDGEKQRKKSHKKHADMFKSIVDTSGRIDGEEVEGLVKQEVKKLRKKFEKVNNIPENQEQYILEKLFSKKGVSGALEHDSVVDPTKKLGSIRVNVEAQAKADLALQALRKSRLNSWHW